MKRFVLFLVVLAAVFASFSCGGTAKLKDGVYFAQDNDFAPQGGWKEQVVVTVTKGRIAAVDWNGVSNLGVADKKTVARTGGYGMVKASKLGLEWHEQAANVEAYVVKTQDLAFGKFKDDGTTDAISGASLHVKNFYDLANKAVAAGPVAKGIYAKDGWYFAEQADFDAETGWKDSVLCTVVNGALVDVVWNATNSDPAKKSKLLQALAGTYGMARVAKLGEWNVQAAAVQAELLKVQDPAKIPLKEDGTSDAVSGASIHLTAVTLAAQALAAAR
jgi:major membrane immunogen (membrane-anchored lipoprotein)